MEERRIRGDMQIIYRFLGGHDAVNKGQLSKARTRGRRWKTGKRSVRRHVRKHFFRNTVDTWSQLLLENSKSYMTKMQE